MDIFSSFIFQINKHNHYVNQLGLYQNTNIPFDDFFDKYISNEILRLDQNDYSKEKLLSFFENAKINDELIFKSNESKVNYCFLIINVDALHVEIEIKKLLNENLDNKDFDFLTNTYSRGYLFSEIQKQLDKGNNGNSYLLMIDLDNFKTVNDSHGHIIGDACLKSFANKLKVIFKNYLFGRFGGDEFLAFVNNISLIELENIVNKVLDITYFFEKNVQRKDVVSCSLGISAPINNRNNLMELIEEADKALYQSKSYGKNIAKIYNGEVFYNSSSKSKKKLENIIKKNNSFLLFNEEIRWKRLKYLLTLTFVIVIFLASVLSLDFFFHFKANEQSLTVAESLMSNQSKLVSSETTSIIDSIFSKLELSKSYLDNIQGDNREQLVTRMITSMNQIYNIPNSGVLLDNGDLYFENNTKYKVSTYDFASKIITNKQRTVDRISLFGKEDQIVFAMPYTKIISLTGEDNNKILGIVSMQNINSFANSLFSKFDNNYYVGLLTENGFKICDKKDSNISIFSNYSNIYNYFDENNISSTGLKVKNQINLRKENVNLYSFNGKRIFIFSSKIEDVEWNIIILVNFSTIYNTFSSVVNYSNFFVNILSIVFILIIIIIFIYFNKIKMQAFVSKYVDPITSTINEQRFYADSNKILAINKNVYMVYLNVRKFKLINKNLGDYKANEYLSRIANIFTSNLKKNEIVSREYSDRFMFLLNSDSDEEIINRIKYMCNQVCSNRELNYENKLSIDVGVYAFPNSIKNNVPIWLAIDRAKRAINAIPYSDNECDIKFFDAKMLEDEELSLYIEQSQDLAIKDRKFKVYYQGKYNLKEHKFTGSEALVRWKDEEKGFINTQKFVDIFEQNGFITKLDLYVFEIVLQDLKKGLENNQKVYPVSVNLSRRNFENNDFFDAYENLIRKYDVDPKYLDFEITESVAFNNNDYNINDVVARIHKLGSKVSIDDFGSGYSNFSLINHIDYDVLKIDRKVLFGKNGFDEYSKNILKSIITLNKEMNKIIVCEGVEHKEESDYLESIGCDYIQGYYYSKPMPLNEYLPFVNKTNKE